MSFPETIFSKISSDTVLPLSLVDDVAAFTVKCKPYNIIDERRGHEKPSVTNASDFVRSPSPAQRRAKRARESTPHIDRTAVTSSTATTTSTTPLLARCHTPMKRARAASSSAERMSSPHKADIKVTKDDLQSEEEMKEMTCTRPVRPGWAARRLSDATPYQIQSDDQENMQHMRYVADEEDMAWCKQQQGIPLPVLQRGMTQLEWAYVAYVRRFHSDASVRKCVQSHILRYSRRRENGNEDTLCAVCGEAVQLMPNVRPTSLINSHNTTYTATCAPHRGVRCAECHTVAHLFCWGLPETFVPTPFAPWVCDGCFSTLRGQQRGVGLRCALCGREAGGQVVFRLCLPQQTSHALSSAASLYESAGEALDESGDVVFLGTLSQKENGQHHQQRVSSASKKANVNALLVCHAVCALACAECAIQRPMTTLRRSGRVNMHSRPSVTLTTATASSLVTALVTHSARRRGRHGPHIACAYCHEGEGGVGTRLECVRCGFPSCGQKVHPSCAAEAHAVCCLRNLPHAVSSDFTEVNTECVPQYWTDCVAYCSLHRARACWGALELYSAQAEEHVYNTTRLVSLAQSEDDYGEVSGEHDSAAKEAVCLSDTVPVRKDKRGHQRQHNKATSSLSRTVDDDDDISKRIREYWRAKRQARREENAQWVYEVNVTHERTVREATLRPELLKLSETRVRSAQLLSLVPEWQLWLMSVIEGALPIADDEYDESDYALRPHNNKASTSSLLLPCNKEHNKNTATTSTSTRSKDTTAPLRNEAWLVAERDALKRVEAHMHMIRALAELVKRRCERRAAAVELQLHEMDIQCGIDHN